MAITYNSKTDRFTGFDPVAEAATNANFEDCMFSLRVTAPDLAAARKSRNKMQLKLLQQCMTEWEANAIGWASKA